MPFAQQLVGPILDGLQSLRGQVRQQEIHPRAIWVHLAASHSGAIELEDHPAHRMQGRMVAHERIAALPVDLAVDSATDRWQRSLETMDDEWSGLSDFDNTGRAAVPAQGAHVVRLSTTGGIERRAIENNAILRC